MARRTLSRITVPIPLGVAGVETRVDPKVVQPPRLRLLENGRFTTPGAITKRRGSQLVADRRFDMDYSALFRKESAITGALGLAARGDELCMYDGWHLYSTNPLQAPYWSKDAKLTGSAPILTARRRERPLPDTASTATVVADCAEVAGLCVVAFGSDTGSTVFILSSEGGNAINLQCTCDGGRPRCVVVGTTIMIFTSRASTNKLFVRTLSLVGGTLVPGPPTTLSLPDTVVASDVHGTNPYFDVAVASNGRVLVAYNSSTANTVKFTYVEPSGALESAFTSQATAATPTSLGVALDDTTGHFAVFWSSASGTEAREFNADKSAAAVVATIDATASARNVCGIWHGAVGAPATRTCRVFIEIAGAQTYLNVIRRATLTAASGAVYLRHSGIASQPWKDGDDIEDSIHILLSHDSTLQATYFVVRCGTLGSLSVVPSMMARILPGLGGGNSQLASHAPGVQSVGSHERMVAVLEKTRLGDTSSTTARRPRIYTLISDAPPTTAVMDGMLITPSGMVSLYDGYISSELGFLLYPENASAASSAAGGSLVAGQTYSYRIYFEFMGIRGRERSTAVAFSVTVGGGHDTETLTLQTLAHTMRGVTLVAFRTAAGGTVFYRCSSADRTTAGATNGWISNATTDTVTFVDKLSDATLQTQEIDYLTAGELDNIAPPSCNIIAAGNNRVILAGFDDPNLIWVSKFRESGEAVTFSDELTISCDAGDGPITGLAYLRDTIVVFREHQTYILGGDGPDNTGSGGEWTPPQIVAEDVGCLEPRSIVRIPGAVLFQSRKGIYSFDGQQTLYIGAPIEGELAGETITSAVALTDSHEARWTLASGRTLVYDYLAQAWTTFTIGGLSACLWNDRWTVLEDSTGLTVAETGDAFTDASEQYALALETAWIHVAAMQDYQRVYSARVIGEWRSPCKILVRVAYDFEETWIDLAPHDPSTVIDTNHYGDGTYGTGNYGGSGTSTVLQFEIRPRRHRCRAIRFRFDEIPDGVNALGEGFTLSEILLDIGVKSGPMPLATSRRAA